MPELRAITPGNRGRLHMVRAVAARQEGVVGRAQLLKGGASDTAIDRALRSGVLHLLHPGVYSVVAPELLTEDGRLIAALMAAGPGALLSRGTAAWRYGQRALMRALAESEFQHDLRPDDVVRVLRRGHPGSAKLRATLRAHAPGHGEAKSRLERRFRALLIERGIELPLRNHPIGPWVADCVWPDRRVVVELDGRQHSRPHQADSDDDRDPVPRQATFARSWRALAAAGCVLGRGCATGTAPSLRPCQPRRSLRQQRGERHLTRHWLRRNRYVPRRYGTKQVDEQPDAVIADLFDAFSQAFALGYGC